MKIMGETSPGALVPPLQFPAMGSVGLVASPAFLEALRKRLERWDRIAKEDENDRT